MTTIESSGDDRPDSQDISQNGLVLYPSPNEMPYDSRRQNDVNWGDIAMTIALQTHQYLHHSIALEQIIQTAVDGAHRLLGCDRVVLYHCQSNWGGNIRAEAAAAAYGAMIPPSLPSFNIEDQWSSLYPETNSIAIADMTTVSLSHSQRTFLAPFQAQAHLLVPVLSGPHLGGVLMAHQCAAPRLWQPAEISGLQQVSLQLGIALHQVSLTEQVQAAQSHRAKPPSRLNLGPPPTHALGIEQCDGFMTHTPMLAWLVDADGILGYANPAYLTVAGKTEEAVLGQSREELFPVDAHHHTQQIIATGAVLETIERASSPDNTSHTYLVRRFPLYENGRCCGIGGMAIDITDRQHIEETLRQSEATNQAIISAIPDLLLRVGRDGSCRSFLPPVDGQPGIFLSVQRHLSEVLPPDLLDHEFQRIEQALTTGELQVWEHQLVKNGDPCYEEIRLMPCAEDECLVIVRDVTERKQIELALQAKTEELEQFFSVGPDLLCIADLNGYFRHLNEQWHKTLGYSLDELEGNRFLDYVHPDDMDCTLKAISALLEHKQPILNLVNRYRCRDGSYRWLEWHSVLAGNTMYAVARDITQHQQARQALRDSEMLLSGILNSSLDGIMAFRSIRDPQGAIIDFEWLLSNSAACTMVERSSDQLIGHRLLEEMPGNKTDGLFDWYVQVVESGQAIQKEFYYNHDGIESWFETIAIQLGDGFVVTFRNVTNAKQSEQTLYLANQQLEDRLGELNQRHAEMVLLGEMSEFLQACLTVGEACEAIGNLIEPFFPNCSGHVFITNPFLNRLEVAASWGSPCDSSGDFSPQDCWGLRRGRAHWVEENRLGLRCKHVSTTDTTAVTLCLPMIAQGETLGLFYLTATTSESLPEDKRQLARTVAEQVALAIANLQLRETLQHQSIRDPLTGLFNRRHLEDALHDKLLIAQRQQTVIGLIMVDIDHFKQFNDTYGHDAGDHILQSVSSLLKTSLSNTEIICRYGGEEILIILPGASLAETYAKADAIRIAISQLHLHHNGKQLTSVTASLGVAGFPDHGATGAALIRAADAALYRAKTSGRNQVLVALT